MNETLFALITFYSSMYGIDNRVSFAVAQVESGFNNNVIGSKNERGVFQLNPKSFPKYSIKYLTNIQNNIRLGIQHLAWNKKYCIHQHDLDWLTCFNAGINKAKSLKYPHLFNYVKKVKKVMSKFKMDEPVVVKGLFVNNVDGNGIYKGVTEAKGFKGYYKILDEYGNVIPIEPERVFSVDEYRKDKKK